MVGQRLADVGTVSTLPLIKNISLPLANTLYPYVLPKDFAFNNMQVASGSVNMTFTNDILSDYWTLWERSCYWDHFPEPLEAGVTIYFWTPIGGAVIQLLFGYRGA